MGGNAGNSWYWLWEIICQMSDQRNEAFFLLVAVFLRKIMGPFTF